MDDSGTGALRQKDTSFLRLDSDRAASARIPAAPNTKQRAAVAALCWRWSVGWQLETAADHPAQNCADRGCGNPAVTLADLASDRRADNGAAERAQRISGF